MKKYIHNVLVGLDQFCNTILGGHPDETISARSGRAAQNGKLWGKALSAGLNLVQQDHCVRAMAGDEARAEKVDVIEEGSYDAMTPKQKADYNTALKKKRGQ